MAKIRIALMQLLPGKSRQENLHKGLAACRAARKAGARSEEHTSELQSR